MGTKRLDLLKAGTTDMIDITMKAAKTITNYQQKLVLNIEYQDASGNFILTDNGTRYQLRAVKNTSGTVLPTIGIIIEI